MTTIAMVMEVLHNINTFMHDSPDMYALVLGPAGMHLSLGQQPTHIYISGKSPCYIHYIYYQLVYK